jgi:hypothetical protein
MAFPNFLRQMNNFSTGIFRRFDGIIFRTIINNNYLAYKFLALYNDTTNDRLIILRKNDGNDIFSCSCGG